MTNLVSGKVYTLEMKKEFPSMINENKIIKFNEVEYIGRKGPKHHFFIWDEGKDLYLTKDEVQNFIK